MQDLFGTEGMTAFSTLFFGMHLLSFLVLIVIVHEFRVVERRHADLVAVLRQEGPAKYIKRSVLLWIYTLSTIAIFIVSAVLLVFQPHLI